MSDFSGADGQMHLVDKTDQSLGTYRGLSYLYIIM